MKSQNIYDRKARTFRILAGVLIVYLGSMAAVTFYNFGRSTSDENWFRDPPSNVYVVRSIPVAAHAPERTFQVRVGDLLVSVNGREVHDARQADSALRSFSGDSLVHLAVMRPVADETVEGKVRRDSLATLWYRGIPPQHTSMM